MKFLLDTHVWIWAANGDSRLPRKYAKIIGRAKSQDLAILDISIWEAGCVQRDGELTKGDPRSWFSLALENVTVLPITPAVALLEQSLAWEHRDPADRLIAAAALIYALPLMTADRRFVSWGGVRIQ